MTSMPSSVDMFAARRESQADGVAEKLVTRSGDRVAVDCVDMNVFPFAVRGRIFRRQSVSPCLWTIHGRRLLGEFSEDDLIFGWRLNGS